MSVFVDASAWVAIMTDEPGAFALEEELGAANDRLYSAISRWETTRAISRERSVTLSAAHDEVESFIGEFALRIVPIGAEEAEAAIDAHRRYGKGTGHRANLNMGDCFAYACAKTNEAALLYKGDDFSHTDLR